MIIYITGCCGGIGQELVKKYINDRFNVVGIDNNQEELNKLVDTYGDRFYPCSLDLTKKKDTADGLKKAIKQYGIPDIFVNCAGIVSLRPFYEESERDFYKVMEVNFLSIKRIIDIILPFIEKKGGKIVNVASVAGVVSAPLLASYCASKAALISYSECLQRELELKNSNVKLILVCPGFIDTPLIKMGDNQGFPTSLKGLLSKPNKVAKEIIKAVDQGKEYVDPTLNGKIITLIERLSPKAIRYITSKVMSKGMKNIFSK